ncbi:MAG TPA: protein kinase [Bryobacteraceae bacterium]|nr:protein kinase [Bryobacteraceae bacterium]
MLLSAGDRIGPYEMLARIGSGGMGEVWKARDTRLNRVVAIKSNYRPLSERFHREAQAIAALNHPHICSLYDVGPEYLVMEYVEGQPLRGPVALPEALRLAEQILDALDVAHRTGITHRDLKPGNILVGPNGVKVLDFGLAKMERPDSAGCSQTATDTLPITAEGTILGTLQYMSPEQIEGREADARSDIFAFGIVLYELISGRRPFAGNSQPSLIASILKEQSRPLRELLPGMPPGLERVIHTCLEKNPDKRWQSAREIRHALEWTTAELPPVAAPAARLRLWHGVAALALVVTLGLGWKFWSPPAPGQTIQLVAPLPENAKLYAYVSVSPDGRKLAFTSVGGASNTTELRIRDLGSLEWRALPGTEGAGSPFWSPDSRYVAFADGNQLKKIAIGGGPPQTLCTMQARIEGSGSWNRNGMIIFGSWGGGAGGPLWKISESGGTATALTEVDTSRGELYHTWPSFTEDGEHFLYFRSGTDGAGIYAGSITAKPAEQSRDRILATDFAASYSNGYLFFVRADTLLAQPFDPGALKLKGEAVPLAESLQTSWFGTGVFSVSSSGVLAYRASTMSGDSQLTWLDRQGKVLGTVGSPGPNSQVSLSPDGSRAAVRNAGYDRSGDLWTVDLASGRRTRLTFLQSDYSPAVWSPDSSRIIFSGGKASDTIYEKPSSGGGEEKVLLRQPGTRLYPTSWSHDGRFLLYHTENTPNTGYDLWVLPLEGDHKPVRLLGEAFNEWAGVFSPDGRWIAYASTEAAGAGTYVRPFLAAGPSGEPAVGQGKWQVSREGGNWPKWIGKEIISSDVPSGTAQFAVQVKPIGDGFESGVPQRLFAGPATGITDWDLSADGRRFLWAVPTIQQSGQVPITVVLNWTSMLKQ